jgi:hypothetical protein
MDVDPAPVSITAVIPRMIRLAPTKWEPAKAPAYAEAETKSSEPSDKSRPVERIRVDRTGSPAPVARRINPTAIVIRCKTPGLSANPGPAPRRNIGPVAVAVRSPIRTHIVRCPNVSISRILFPGSVVIQIAVADCVAVHILCGWRTVFAQIALLRPLIQSIRSSGSSRGNFRGSVCPSDIDAFAGFHRINLSGRGNFSCAANRRNAGEVSVLIYIDAERACFFHRER